MTYWCYYTRVVSYLERLEATQAAKTQTGAYLVWRDDDGPWMVAGPDIDWFRGDGPCPLGDLAGQPISVKNKAMPTRQSCQHHAKKQQSRRRKPVVKTANKAHPAAKVDKFAAEKPARPKRTSQAIPTKCHAGSSAIAAAKPIAGDNQSGGRPCPPKTQANKRRTLFLKPAQTCSHPVRHKKKQQRRGRQSTLRAIKDELHRRPARRSAEAVRLCRATSGRARPRRVDLPCNPHHLVRNAE